MNIIRTMVKNTGGLIMKQTPCQGDSLESLAHTDTIQTYFRLLRGEIKTYPPVFFAPYIKKKRIEQMIRYLVEEILKITPEEAYKTLTLPQLKKHKMDVLLRYVDPFPEWTDQRAIQRLLRSVYPRLPEEKVEELVIATYEEVLSGTRKNFPPNYFHDKEGEERAKICVRYMIEKKLQIPPEEAPKLITRKTFHEYKLKILLNLFYDSPFEILTSIYPTLTSKDFR